MANSEDTVWIEHDGVLQESDKAVLFDTTENGELWVPRSLIADQDGSRVGVPRWFADKNDIEVEDW